MPTYDWPGVTSGDWCDFHRRLVATTLLMTVLPTGGAAPAPELTFMNSVNQRATKGEAFTTKLAGVRTAVAQVSKGVNQPSKPSDEFRRPANDAELKFWLENMIVFHHFTLDEVRAATGFTLEEIRDASRRLGLEGKALPLRKPGDPIRVLPYPGGRHPRIGFLEGAIRPQRETKVSVFTPWDDASYVVADIPEAIFSNLGLIYLAHTHVPTIWDRQGIVLPRQEWQREDDGSLHSERTLPGGIVFGADIRPTPTAVRIGLWLRNGSKERLTGLRVQNCVMVARAAGFEAQTNANKIFRAPYAAVRSANGRRWIITAWSSNQRCWGNDRCPCLHSDPQFPACAPGETVRVRGWLSFYEGEHLEDELKRIDQSGWRDGGAAQE